MVMTVETTDLLELLGGLRFSSWSALRRRSGHSQLHTATQLSRSNDYAQGFQLLGTFVVKRLENSRSIFPPIRPARPTAAIVKTRLAPRFALG
jgi:hypothetical protein